MAIACFLKMAGIEGESVVREFVGQIEVLAWSFGVQQPGAAPGGSGGGSGRVEVRDLAITKWLDRATPVLIQACCAGRRFADATLSCRRGGPSPAGYARLNLDDVLITSVATGGSAGADRFTEEISLSFARVTLTYARQRPDGSAGEDVGPFGWDIQGNVPIRPAVRGGPAPPLPSTERRPAKPFRADPRRRPARPPTRRHRCGRWEGEQAGAS